MTTPQHDSSCRWGFGIFLTPTDTSRYAVVSFFNCGWGCEAQATHRFSKVAELACAYHNELTWSWLDKPQRRQMADRARYHNVGYMSMTVTGEDRRWVIAPPQAMKSRPAQPSIKVVRHTLQTALPMGIERLDKSRLWTADNSGYIKIAQTDAMTLDYVTRQLAKAGLEHGQVLNPRPIEQLSEDVTYYLESPSFD